MEEEASIHGPGAEVVLVISFYILWRDKQGGPRVIAVAAGARQVGQ
jgi:hypothetical protein